MAENRYTKATQENGQLETRLGVTKVAFHAIEEETNIAWARLPKADAMVAGDFHYSRENPHSILENHLLNNF
jgi:hypothetical protein